MPVRLTTPIVIASLVIGLAGCGGNAKTYDIGPIFPLSPDKCAKYDGDESGQGVIKRCMVTKEMCEKAAADWKAEMASGYVNDAIQFTCD